MCGSSLRVGHSECVKFFDPDTLLDALGLVGFNISALLTVFLSMYVWTRGVCYVIALLPSEPQELRADPSPLHAVLASMPFPFL